MRTLKAAIISVPVISFGAACIHSSVKKGERVDPEDVGLVVMGLVGFAVFSLLPKTAIRSPFFRPYGSVLLAEWLMRSG